MTAVPHRGTGPSDDGPAVQADPFVDAVPVADAVLYEGYVLYPYRAESMKNQVRFQWQSVPVAFLDPDNSSGAFESRQ